MAQLQKASATMAMSEEARHPFDVASPLCNQQTSISKSCLLRYVHQRRGLTLLANVTKHVRMNVQADIGHVVQVFACHKPDDLADRAFGVMSAHASEGIRLDVFVSCQLRHIVECGSVCIREKRARPVFFQRIEFGLIHRSFNGERPANVDVEKADVDASYLFSDEHNSLAWQLQLLVKLADLPVKETKRSRQSRAMDLKWCEDLAKLPACKVIRQLHCQPSGFFNWGKKSASHGFLPCSNITFARGDPSY